MSQGLSAVHGLNQLKVSAMSACLTLRLNAKYEKVNRVDYGIPYDSIANWWGSDRVRLNMRRERLELLAMAR